MLCLAECCALRNVVPCGMFSQKKSSKASEEADSDDETFDALAQIPGALFL